MQAINNYVIIEVKKEGPKKMNGLIFTEKTDSGARYRKAHVVSVGNLVEVVKKGDVIYYDANAGHDISYSDEIYQVIRSGDIVLVQ